MVKKVQIHLRLMQTSFRLDCYGFYAPNIELLLIPLTDEIKYNDQIHSLLHHLDLHIIGIQVK